ncbi:GUN4 domain-containing protein [Anabaena sp. UHCC 0451]|uniref:GUN4 domain-containing protein n=1 Tax=Anabaena sp. UHCC 0451 TaxID=2055235 RepID=UPI002B1F8F4B|nr:GUN4 domain-containing protein [Anabaena sp. UHCC 0451]MEA5574821.1 GUN4 domain-containing protein [Anabaena sp. UHCC 0451]
MVSLEQDYARLQHYLAEGRYQEADKETLRVMLAILNPNNLKFPNYTEGMKNFTCKDLITIDDLWIKYSNGKFGFSAQKEIYDGLGGRIKYSSEDF